MTITQAKSRGLQSPIQYCQLLVGGGINKHVYYGCTKVRDKSCKCGYINEVDLLKQFTKLIDTIDIDETSIREKLKEEVGRFKKFQQFILGKKENVVIANIDIRNYAKYLLQEGKDIEKRELLGCLKGEITLSNKVISLKR